MLGAGPPDSCCTLAETSHLGDISALPLLHGLTCGYRERGSNTLLCLISPTCVKSLINNHVNQLINKHPSLSLSLPEKVGAFKSNRLPEGAVEIVIKFYHFVMSIASPTELSLRCCMRVKTQMSLSTDVMINFASKKFRDDMMKN